MEKECTKCGGVKDVLLFDKQSSSKDGYNSWCKECRSTAHKKDYAENTEYYKQKNKNYYNDNVEVIATRQSKYRSDNKTIISSNDKVRDRKSERRFAKSKTAADKRKLIWEITLEQFTELCELDCFYCSNKLEQRKYSTGAALDRKNNSIGYTIDNVLPSCATCNYLRGDIMTVEETQQIVKLLITLRGL